MTIETLKSNKNEIIARIAEISNLSNAKEIMTCMINLLEGEMNESNDVISLVDECVDLLSFRKKEVVKGDAGFVIGGVDYGTQAEYQRSCMGKKWSR